MLTLQSPVDADAPWFDLDCPADLTAGDQIEVQYGTAADFAGATSVVTTLTTQQASYGVLDLNRTALTNATTYYFRARYIYANSVAGREKLTGPWSRTQSYTVATVSVPGSPAVSGNKISGYADPNSNFNLNSLQGRDFDLGQPDAGRNIILAGGGTMNTTAVAAYVNTDKNIAAGDYLGTALTERIKPTFASSRTTVIYSGVVASGRSGRISVHMGAGFNVAFGVLKAYGLSSATPANTQSTGPGGFPADPFNIGSSFTMPASGFAVAVGESGGVYASRAWINSFSEALVSSLPSTAFVTIGVRTASGSTQAAFNRSNFQQSCGCVAAWN